jgi:hypothetical protein
MTTPTPQAKAWLDLMKEILLTDNPEGMINAAARQRKAEQRMKNRPGEGRATVETFAYYELEALRYRILELQARGPDEWHARKLIELIDAYRDAADERFEVRELVDKITAEDLAGNVQAAFDHLRQGLEFKPETIDELEPDPGPWQTLGTVYDEKAKVSRAMVMIRELPEQTALEAFKGYHASKLAEARGDLAVKIGKELLDLVKVVNGFLQEISPD